MKILKLFSRFRWYIAITVVFAIGVYYYFNIYSAEDASASFYVVETVARGEVTSGIQTTGDIIAAQKLDIDVYKQLSRIDVVNVVNGSHVESGEVLVSFDKSDVYVDTQSSLVTVLEAELAFENEQTNASDPNTKVRTLENQIAGYKKSIEDAYLDFLNEDIEVASANRSTENKTRPTISGRYVKNENEYRIIISVPEYNDKFKIESGFIYKVFDNTGMISEHELIYGIATPIADTGLKILFSNTMNPSEGDKWEILTPNTEISTYYNTKADYEKTVQDLKVSLVNAEQELEDLKQTDSSAYRNLEVEKAEASLAVARQRLSENYDIVQERDIVAPFSGTVEGIENVVAGATPTGGTSDTINLGTLISDDFLTTFSLGATDVAKVSVGQKVKVTVTSFSEQSVFEAVVTQISSLPESSGVAQYRVQALLDYDRTTAQLVLREGMLADIEVVEEENPDALRVPVSAITYEQGTPKITIVDQLTEEQKQQAERMGIVRTTGVTIETYKVEVKLGIVGQYYAEVLSGVEVGDIIVASSLTENIVTESVVGQSGFGPGARPTGSGGGTPPVN